MKKRKRLWALFMVCVFTLALTSCGSGITEEQHNEVLAERDALQAELRELQESRPTAEQYDEVLAERDALQTELQELQESRPTAKQYEGVCVQRDALQAELQELQESRITVQQYNEVCGERDALQAELQRMREEQQPEQPDTMLVNITGSFTATVRHLIPDYVLDGWTPNVAVLTQFISFPYAVYVGDFGQQLEVGQTYVFEVEPEVVQVSRSELERIGINDLLAVNYFRLTIVNARIAEEGEMGLASKNLTIERLPEET